MAKIALYKIFGTQLYIGSEIAFSINNDISSEQDEILWMELHLPKTKPIIVGTCYRPSKQNDFIDQFENNLSKLRSDCDIITLGDFDICLQ